MLDRAMDTIYQYTYVSDKNRKIRQIIGMFHQIYTFCIIHRPHQELFLTSKQFKAQICLHSSPYGFTQFDHIFYSCGFPIGLKT